MADTLIKLTGDPPLPFRAVDLGDGSYALAVAVVTPDAGDGADTIFRPTGDPPLPFRAINNNDGSFSLSVSAQ